MSDRRLVCLTEVPTESLSWLWPGRIPLGGITVLDGDPGDGKSTLLYDLSARITTGRPTPFTSDALAPSGVVLLQGEDFLSATVRPTLEAFGADLSRIIVFDKRRFADKPFRLPEDMEIIRQAIEEVKGKLVVIDPLSSFIGGSPNSEQIMRSALGPLAALAEEMGVAVVIVRHLTKNRASNTKYKGSGSMGIIAAARSSLLIEHDPSRHDPHQHMLVLNKSNLSAAPAVIYRTVKTDSVITVQWLSECPHDVLCELNRDGFEHSQLEEASYVLYSILSDYEGPMPARDVQKEAMKALVAPRTLKRAKSQLRIVSRRVRIEEEEAWQWVWELPKDQSQFQAYKDRALQEHATHTTGGDDSHTDVVSSLPEPGSTQVESPLIIPDRPREDAKQSEGGEEEPDDNHENEAELVYGTMMTDV